MDCMSIQVCRGKQKFLWPSQVGKDYLDRAYEQCKKTQVFSWIKIQNICLSKDNIMRVQKETCSEEEILVIHIWWQKWFISRTG